MAEEVGKLVKEVETLNDENGLLQGESVEETPESEFELYNKMSRHL